LASTVCLALSLSAPVHAQPLENHGAASTEVDAISDREFAQALATYLQSGDFNAALALLRARPDLAAMPAGVRLHAEVLAKLHRTDEAIAMLEQRLAKNRDDAVARFQLGEIHFAAHRDRAAALAYRLALAGRLDLTRGRIISARLSQIEDRRDLILSISASVAPDSNINGATSASTVELFGLPFNLSDDARRRDGVSATLAVSAERRLRLPGPLSVRNGVALALVETSGRAFDQSQLALFSGPSVRLANHGQVSLLATYRRMTLGGAPFETWRGVKGEIEGFATPRNYWSGSIHLDRIDGRRAQDGWSYGLDASRTHLLGPSSLWRAGATLELRDTPGFDASFTDARLSGGRLFSLPLSVQAFAEPYARQRRFAQVSALYGVRRIDHEVGANLRLSKRDWVVMGAFPFAQATLSKSASNVSLGRYSRQRLEFGFTRDF
jgi:hypothetical protein